MNLCRKILSIAMIAVLVSCEKGADNFSATLMDFKSPEGVEKAELSIFGTAKEIVFNGEKMQKDIEISGKTLFVADIEPSDLKAVEFTADNRKITLNLDARQNWTVNKIEMKNNTALLHTAINPPLSEARVLLWTTVQETAVQLDDIKPVVWIKRPLFGGYWLFDVKEARKDVTIKVTPPESLENSTPEEIADILLSKVSSFNLVVIGKQGEGRIITVTVPLSEAGTALGKKEVGPELFEK